ncbi:hypothetical protein Agub_g4118 [Astrephomene gubernaculifera]|uniref:Membrane insertase YidC/Oxa/ALB C-terminal domain-containing protein n=1 Tax=Astrephomene gubernaculifera TaxID=47775 RepID=A0AAD3HJQ6_9CHLO|nr:hypothetical protein Agub_g4118 [Astrephomene gubernaculifera]
MGLRYQRFGIKASNVHGPLRVSRRPITAAKRPGRTRFSCRAMAEYSRLPEKLVAGTPSVLDKAAADLNSFYTLAGASESTASAVTVAATVRDHPTVQRAGGWVSPLADALEQVLYLLQEGLDKVHVPYSYGYSIILLTLFVKIATFPLTKQQVESALAVQALKPRVDLIRDRYGEDKEKIQKETSMLYEQAGVNPLAGCLPTLATIPIFIGLYSSLTNVANEGSLDTQGFYWIPSLAGPTTLAMRQSGLGTSWLLPLVDGVPPIGWSAAAAYLVLPVLLVLVQWAASAVTSPPIDPKDENANTQRALLVGLPLMIGWFALNVPSGLSLYYLANTTLSAAQQIYLKKLGGAQVAIRDLGPVTKPGSGRRAGGPALGFSRWAPTSVKNTAEAAKERAAAEAAREAAVYDGYSGGALAANVTEERVDPAKVDRRCKRRRLSSLVQDGSGGGLATCTAVAAARIS